jgi:hypothetical protein
MKRILPVVAISCALTSCAKAEETVPFAIAAPQIVDTVQTALSEAAICSGSVAVGEKLLELDRAIGTDAYAWTCLPADQTLLQRSETEKPATKHSRTALREAGISLAESLPTPPINLSGLGRIWGPPEYPAADQTVALLQSSVMVTSDAALVFLGATGRYIELLPLDANYTTNLENTAVSNCQDTVGGICRAGAFFDGSDIFPTYVRP